MCKTTKVLVKDLPEDPNSKYTKKKTVKCSKCKTRKSKSQMTYSRSSDGEHKVYQTMCKACANMYTKTYQDKIVGRTTRVCKGCAEEYTLTEHSYIPKSKGGHQGILCASCTKNHKSKSGFGKEKLLVKTCINCLDPKPFSEFYKKGVNKEASQLRGGSCNDCCDQLGIKTGGSFPGRITKLGKISLSVKK